MSKKPLKKLNKVNPEINEEIKEVTTKKTLKKLKKLTPIKEDTNKDDTNIIEENKETALEDKTKAIEELCEVIDAVNEQRIENITGTDTISFDSVEGLETVTQEAPEEKLKTEEEVQENIVEDITDDTNSIDVEQVDEPVSINNPVDEIGQENEPEIIESESTFEEVTVANSIEETTTEEESTEEQPIETERVEKEISDDISLLPVETSTINIPEEPIASEDDTENQIDTAINVSEAQENLSEIEEITGKKEEVQDINTIEDSDINKQTTDNSSFEQETVEDVLPTINLYPLEEEKPSSNNIPINNPINNEIPMNINGAPTIIREIVREQVRDSEPIKRKPKYVSKLKQAYVMDSEELADEILIDEVSVNSHGMSDEEIAKSTFADILRVILKDTDVTDVTYNGQDVYIQHNKKGRYKFSGAVTNQMIDNFIKDVCNPLNEYFNTEHPILDCEIKDLYTEKGNAVLRLNAVHESVSPYGNTAAIRITQPELRLTEEDNVFASKQIFKLIEAMVRGNLNILISGRTGSGKTELQKFLVNYIRDAETIVLIEDTKDTDLKDLYPKKNISSWITNTKIEEVVDFDVLIRASLRNNPDWIIISETRGSEAYSMIKSGLSGHKIITTLHSDSAESNIDRLIHMCKEKYDLDQMLLGKMITDVFDIGIHIDYDITKEGTKRYICQIVEYIDYSDEGVIVNPIFQLKLQPIKQKDGTYKYQKVASTGKISKELFDKLAKKKVLSKDIEEFIEEDYYGKEE